MVSVMPEPMVSMTVPTTVSAMKIAALTANFLTTSSPNFAAMVLVSLPATALPAPAPTRLMRPSTAPMAAALPTSFHVMDSPEAHFSTHILATPPAAPMSSDRPISATRPMPEAASAAMAAVTMIEITIVRTTATHFFHEGWTLPAASSAFFEISPSMPARLLPKS
jgi:hypothetical protein